MSALTIRRFFSSSWTVYEISLILLMAPHNKNLPWRKVHKCAEAQRFQASGGVGEGLNIGGLNELNAAA